MSALGPTARLHRRVGPGRAQDTLKLKGVCFATAVVERYKRRGTSVGEAIIEIHLAGVATGVNEDGYREVIG